MEQAYDAPIQDRNQAERPKMETPSSTLLIGLARDSLNITYTVNGVRDLPRRGRFGWNLTTVVGSGEETGE